MNLADQLQAAELAQWILSNRAFDVEPPRSWPTESKALFLSLPNGVKQIVARREHEREAALRTAQNRAAEAEQKLQRQSETISRQAKKIANLKKQLEQPAATAPQKVKDNERQTQAAS